MALLNILKEENKILMKCKLKMKKKLISIWEFRKINKFWKIQKIKKSINKEVFNSNKNQFLKRVIFIKIFTLIQSKNYQEIWIYNKISLKCL
jgi:hypothetical protein